MLRSFWRKPKPAPANTYAGKWTELVALGSFLISCASLFLSLYVLRLSHVERLTVEVYPFGSRDFATVVWRDTPEQTGVVQVFWEALLSNTGDRRLSVVSYDVRDVTNGQNAVYNSLKGGLFDTRERPLSLPITLEPGESTLLLLKIGLLLHPRAVEVLQEAVPFGKPISRTDLQIALAKAGIDIYGNPIELTTYPGGKRFLIGAPPEKRTEQAIQIHFSTGGGLRVQRVNSWYGQPAMR